MHKHTTPDSTDRPERTVTLKELDALEALAEKAAPGPWVARDCGDVCCQWISPADDPDTDVLVNHQDRATYEFIAATRTAVPALINELRTLRAQLNTATAQGWDEGYKWGRSDESCGIWRPDPTPNPHRTKTSDT